MPEINICNSAGRDAVVSTQSARATRKVRWLDGHNRQVNNTRILKSSIDRDIAALVGEYGDLEKVGEALLTGDPEVDLETTGQLLHEVSRVYVNQDRELVHKISRWEIIRDPDGTVRDRRPRQLPPPNVAVETPMRWSGKLIRKQQAYRKFVFVNKMQLVHVNGLTYDFLYGIAKELEDADSLMLVGAGPKSNQPLILRRGASPYRGFLEGRTRGDKYCLILHLSNLELKAPAKADPVRGITPKHDAAKKRSAPSPKPSSEKTAAAPDDVSAGDEALPASETKASAKKAAKKKAVKKKAVKKKAVKKKAVKKKAAKKIQVRTKKS